MANLGKHPGGRPRKEIDIVQFEKLCGMQCTKEEICSFLDITDKTLDAWCARTYFDEFGNPMSFSDVFQKKRAKGKISLRRAQFKLAEKNATMAIFLGKQYLGQREQVEVEHKNTNNLLEAIKGLNEVNTDDLPEVE